ncbi:MAG: transposase [Phycisphaerales bacterium]|nr:transposase [Phycisphaerales bacterium]
MARTLLPDGLWERIRPLLPQHPRRVGRPWVDDWACLEGIFFVLQSGIAWSLLPPQFGTCGMTCWRRLRDWKRAGVWERVHAMLLGELHAVGQLEPRVAVADSTSLRAIKGAKRPAATE